jgi:hypothetical protein
LTDEFGKLTVTMDKAGEYLFISGMDASQVFVEPVTSNTTFGTNKLTCKVYPNPFTDYLLIECPTPEQWVEITDLQGRIVYSASWSEGKIDLRLLPSGIYLLKIHSGQVIFYQKLIKQ